MGHMKPSLVGYIRFTKSNYTFLERPSPKLSKNIEVMLFSDFNFYLGGEKLPIPHHRLTIEGAIPFQNEAKTGSASQNFLY